jgi:hypothetical protein
MEPKTLNYAFPELRRPDQKAADGGAVRFGHCAITAQYPELRRPHANTAERGTIRIGDCAITAELIRAINIPR